MEELAEKKYFWQDRDDSFSEVAEKYFYSKKDQLADKVINYVIEDSFVSLQAEGGFITIGEIENVAFTPATGTTLLITSQPSTHDFWGGGSIRFIEGKSEIDFYHPERQSAMGDGEGYIIDFKMNKPTISDEDLAKWKQFSTNLNVLQELYREYSFENWDGYGAAPISIDAYSEAARFLKMLPSAIPLPDIAPEPGGEIALEWYKGEKNIFLVSLSGNNIISYAGLFGEKNKTYGTESFGNQIPEIIIESVRRLFPEDQ